MQSMTKSATEHHKVKPTILNTAAYIYKENGLRGLYRGVSPRICLGVWQTVRVIYDLTIGVYGLVCRYCARLARHEQVDAD